MSDIFAGMRVCGSCGRPAPSAALCDCGELYDEQKPHYDYYGPDQFEKDWGEAIITSAVLVAVVSAFILLALFLTWIFSPSKAEAQYADPYVSRAVVPFPPDTDFNHCQDHWNEDLTLLRNWQHEHGYWQGEYNLCADIQGYGPNHWPVNTTMENYPVDPEIIRDEYYKGYYPTLIDACNAHILAAHTTENQMAAEVYQLHINLCHCRQGLGIDRCNQDYYRRRPYRYYTPRN